MATVTYRHPTVNVEVLQAISNNYYIDTPHLSVLTQKEHRLHPKASLDYLVEGYVACTLNSRQIVFWYQMGHFPYDEDE